MNLPSEIAKLTVRGESAGDDQLLARIAAGEREAASIAAVGVSAARLDCQAAEIRILFGRRMGGRAVCAATASATSGFWTIGFEQRTFSRRLFIIGFCTPRRRNRRPLRRVVPPVHRGKQARYISPATNPSPAAENILLCRMANPLFP